MCQKNSTGSTCNHMDKGWGSTWAAEPILHDVPVIGLLADPYSPDCIWKVNL